MQKKLDTKLVKEWYIKGYIAREIAENLKYNLESVKNIIKRNLKDYKEEHELQLKKRKNIDIKNLYIKGYTIKEIADTLNLRADNVKKIIQYNFKDLKLINKEKLLLRKEVGKVLNYENSRFIGDSQLVKKNMNVYDINTKGDRILNKKNGYIYTNDMPLRLINEDGRAYKKTFTKKRCSP